MKRLLILGAPVYQIPVVEQAKKMGCHVGIVDVNPNAPALSLSDDAYIASIQEYDSVLNIAHTFKPDGIICGTCESGVINCSKLCEELNLPGIPLETALKATHKVKMLEAFQKRNVPHPKFMVVEKSEVTTFKCEKIEYPLISKPVDSSAGRGVSIIHNEHELNSALLFSSNNGISGDVLLEEYLDGPEVSVEVLVINGEPNILQITDKITSGEPHFYEIGHSQPSQLSHLIKEEIKQIASAAVLSVGLVNSAAHVEIKITKDGPKLVELGARLGGGFITSYLLSNSVVGVNIIENVINLSLGKAPSLGKFQDSGVSVAIRFIPARYGRLRAIRGLPAIDYADNSKVVNFRITAKIGDSYNEATDNSSRFGYVVCKGNSASEALENCDNFIKSIDFDMAV